MDSQANAASPSKVGREGTTGAAELSTPGPEFGTPAAMMMDVSSPDPAPFSFARQKHPPAISSKPRSSRKVSSLFSTDTGEAAGPSDDSSVVKKGCGDVSSVAPPGGLLGAGGDQAASPSTQSYSSGSGNGSGGAVFTSPVRASREPGATSSRFTPQRNLGGLFASPLPPPPPAAHEEEGGVTTVVPLLLQSPKHEESDSAAAAADKREGETSGCYHMCAYVLCVLDACCVGTSINESISQRLALWDLPFISGVFALSLVYTTAATD